MIAFKIKIFLEVNIIMAGLHSGGKDTKNTKEIPTEVKYIEGMIKGCKKKDSPAIWRRASCVVTQI